MLITKAMNLAVDDSSPAPETTNPDASSKSVNSFHRFLDAKSKEGFGIQDFFQERLVRTYELRDNGSSLFALLTLFLGGGLIGLWMADKNRVNNPVELNRLKAETEFYRLATKTQTVYNTWMKKPTTANYQAASQAFEELHALINLDGLQDPDTHTQINKILKKLVGANVAQGLLEHFATAELTRGGRFTDVNLFTFYRGPDYQKILIEKAKAGYGTAGINQDGTVSDDPNTIRMVFAQTFRNLLNSNVNPHYTTYTKMLTALRQDISTVEVSERIDSMNDELMQVMQKGEVRNSLIDFVPAEEQKALIHAYRIYIDSESERDRIELQTSQKKEEITQENARVVEMLNASYELSYEELKPLLTSKTDSLSSIKDVPTGFEAFIDRQSEIENAQLAINSIESNIKAANTRIAEEHRKEFANKQEELEALQKEIENDSKDVADKIKATNTAKSDAETARKQAPMFASDAAGAQKIIDADSAKKEYERSAKALNQAQSELKTKEDEAVKLGEELKSSDQICVKKQEKFTSPLKADLEKCQKNYNKLVKQTIKVSGTNILSAQFKTVPKTNLARIVNKITDQLERTNNLQNALVDLNNNLKKAKEAGLSSLATLTSLGFNPDDQSMKYKKFIDKADQVELAVKQSLLDIRRTTLYYINSDFNDTLTEEQKVITISTQGKIKVSSENIKAFIPETHFKKGNESHADFVDARAMLEGDAEKSNGNDSSILNLDYLDDGV